MTVAQPELTTVQRVTGQNMQWRRQDLARA